LNRDLAGHRRAFRGRRPGGPHLVGRYLVGRYLVDHLAGDRDYRRGHRGAVGAVHCDHHVAAACLSAVPLGRWIPNILPSAAG
jgi:hypothetical protein